MSDKNVLLKWVGGKSKLLSHILPKFPKEIDTYYEPFLGGGSVLLGVLEAGIFTINTIRASDLNPELINLYKVIQSTPEQFILETNSLISKYNLITVMNLGTSKKEKTPKTEEEAFLSQENFYYWQRKIYNENMGGPNIILRASLFYFLNKAGFRGLYRTSNNKFNVPFGSYKQITLNEDIVMRQSKLFTNVIFEVKSFEDVIVTMKENDFIYLDPPYLEETSTSFTSYMGKFPHELLLKMLLELREKNMNFIMSNSDVPLIYEKFLNDKFIITTIVVRRAINSKNPADTTNETIIECKF